MFKSFVRHIKDDVMKLVEGHLSLKVPAVAKVVMGFASALVMLTVVGVISFQSIRQFIRDSKSENRCYKVLAAIEVLNAKLREGEACVRAYIITGDKGYLRPLENSERPIQTSIASIEFFTADNSSQQRRLEVVKPLIQKKLDLLKALVDRRGRQGFESAKDLLATSSGVEMMDGIRLQLDGMSEEENRLINLQLAKTEVNANWATLLIVFGSVFTIIAVLLAGVIILRYIIDRAKSECALRASESMFRGLLQSAPDAMVIVDRVGKIKIVNEQAEKLFGYTASELVGQPIEIIVPRRFCSDQICKRDAYLAAPVVRSMGEGQDLFGTRKDGSEFPIEISLSPLKTSDGLHVSSAIRDVTRRKLEEQALEDLNYLLRNSNAQLESANKELESFSYSVSHDLRAPLRSIDGFSLALLEDYSDRLDFEGQDHLRRVRAASQRMGQLIDDLLNLSRVSRSEIKTDTVHLSNLAQELADDLQREDTNRDSEVVITGGMVAQADPRLMRIVLTNLLGNAWKFTSKQPRARIEFGSCQSNGSITYFVKDNGAGFDSFYAGKLFGPFQRLHSADEFPGSGIGLATVQRIIHRQGGRVWAEGKSGEGATFYFTLRK